MSGESVSSHGELIPVPSQRGRPTPINTAATVGERALQTATTSATIMPDIVDGMGNPTTDASIMIPTQGSAFHGNLSAETPLTETVSPDELATTPQAELGENAPSTTEQEAAHKTWKDLVTRAQEGDADAFAEIYKRYTDSISRFVYFRVTDGQVAEDLTAETFLRALRRIDGVEWRGRDIGAWLVTIARNLVADYFKSGRYRFEIVTGDVWENDGVDTHYDASPEEIIIDRMTNEMTSETLAKAVQRLNSEQQECIRLRFFRGLSVAETAQAMGKNEGAIKALQYRAIGNLRRNLPEGFRP